MVTADVNDRARPAEQICDALELSVAGMEERRKMAQSVVCRHCGAHNPQGASWCEKCNRSLEGASPVRADPDVSDGEQLLLSLVREQRELIHGQQRQTELLRMIATAAWVWLALTILSIIGGILFWLL